MNNNNRRRNFRGRQQKNSFRRRAPSNHGSNGHYTSNIGNKNFSRNGSLSNPLSIEKVIFKYQQLAKDAQSSGDPVLIENYLQHAEHFSRKLAEINFKKQPTADETLKNDEVNLISDSPKKEI
ncbi:DUF4167 domain-containing protein [Pelagibacteraceae bacterium]|nr:DUF4167 domain-containing protein [Pelagibacteraceae bacterium]